jgi:NADPH:quinone reductase
MVSYLIPQALDSAEIVEEIREEITNVRGCDRVFNVSLMQRNSTGTFAQQIVCDKTLVHSLLAHVSFEKGASLGVQASIAYRALFQRACLKPCQTVLIHVASDGVGFTSCANGNISRVNNYL